MVDTVMDKQTKVYVMFNERTKVTIETNEKYMPMWLAKGFMVKEILLGEPKKSDAKSQEDK